MRDNFECDVPRCYCDGCGLEFEADSPMYRYNGMLLCKYCLGEAIGVDLEDMDDDEIAELADEYFFEEMDEFDEEDIW